MRGFPTEYSIPEPSGSGAAQKLLEIKGTVMAAVRVGSASGCPSMIAVCFYDSKPVHYLTTIDEFVEWHRKTRRVYTLRGGLFDLSEWTHLVSIKNSVRPSLLLAPTHVHLPNHNRHHVCHTPVIRAAFLRLNIIDMYNFYMGFVDLADQLRNVYRPDHFSRKRKWWTAMFWWAHGVCMTNAYIIYIRVQIESTECDMHSKYSVSIVTKYLDAL